METLVLCVLHQMLINLHLAFPVYDWFRLLGETTLRGQLWMDGALNFTMEGVQGIVTDRVGTIHRLYIHEVPRQAPCCRFSLPSHDFQLSAEIARSVMYEGRLSLILWSSVRWERPYKGTN